MITRAQLLGAGMSVESADRRVASGWLRPLHRGVYLVGPLVSAHAMDMAAVLACGDTAVLSHRSAAVLWKMLPPAAEGRPDVTVTRGSPERPGVSVHRVRTLRPRDVTRLDGIPITAPGRTLRDLAAVASPRELEQALSEALGQRLTTPARLLSALAGGGRFRGARALRAQLDDDRRLLTRSAAEARLLALIRRSQLPMPAVNVRVQGHVVDFLWRRQRLIVEMDGFAFHASRRAFESDRRRDAELTAAGLRVMRVTWRQLVDEPEAVLVRLAQALVFTNGT